MKSLLEIGLSYKKDTNYIMKRGYVEFDIFFLIENKTIDFLHEMIKEQLGFAENCNIIVDLTNKKYIKSQTGKDELTNSEFWGWKMVPVCPLNNLIFTN